jgi:hypothetical protein
MKNINVDDLFTGAKTPEYAVFYNIAYWWISDTLKKLYHTSSSVKEDREEDNSPYVDRFVNEGTNLMNSTLPDSAYLKLRDFLWKGFIFEKNSSGLELTEKEKRLIHKMVAKMVEIRNFHSHVWHDNVNLIFDKELKTWIEYLHEYALQILQKENSREVDKYREKAKNLFDSFGEAFYITQDGRNFFLSFFLKKSEMSRFMQQRKGCKRNDKPEFRIKHLVYRFYCHRDGATKNRYSVENTVFSELDEGSKSEILQARQLYKMLSYLNDIPSQVIDRKLFPLYYQEQPVTNAVEICGFIKGLGILKECDFNLEENSDEGNRKEIIFLYPKVNYSFKILLPALHKILLDIIRNPESENRFYEILEKFSGFRDSFPVALDEFKKGNRFTEEMNEYYTFKLKADDKTRGLLAQIIDSSEKQTVIDNKTIKELKYRVVTEPIELDYYDTCFETGQKLRTTDRFLEFAVNYLIDKKVVGNWEWLIEKFEPEEVIKQAEAGVETKNVIKRVKLYSALIPEEFRLCTKNDHVLVRLKSNPETVFGIGQNAMRNLLLAHFHNHNIDEVLQKLVSDILKIRKTGIKGESLNYSELNLLNDKTIPRYLQLMMRDGKVLQNETLSSIETKAKARIERLVEYFEGIKTGEVKLTRKEINTQLIRCYKFFDWEYPNNSQFKFLRQNEYQLMSIYHYTLAKPENDPRYLRRLRGQLFVDIDKHLPVYLRKVLSEETTLDGLFNKVMDESIGRLKKWGNELSSMNPEQKKNCLSKLGLHAPVDPVPDAANKTNLGQMKNLPLMLHPALVFMAFGYSRDSSMFSTFRENPVFSKGLIPELYNDGSYREILNKTAVGQHKQAHKIVGEINNLKTTDTIIWLMVKEYLKQTTSEIMKNISRELAGKNAGDFRVDKLHSFELPVYRSGKHEPKSYTVTVMFKQLADFMLVTGEPLKNLALQLFRRYPSDKELETVGIILKDGVYQIPYIQIKQEMDRVYHESLMMAEFLLDWEKNIVAQIAMEEKQQLIKAAEINAGQKAYIGFKAVCQQAQLLADEYDELKNIRNHALHAKIPEGWSYKEKLADSRIIKILGITPEKLKKYEKKDSYYEQKALGLNNLEN